MVGISERSKVFSLFTVYSTLFRPSEFPWAAWQSSWKSSWAAEGEAGPAGAAQLGGAWSRTRPSRPSDCGGAGDGGGAGSVAVHSRRFTSKHNFLILFFKLQISLSTELRFNLCRSC